MGNRSHNPETIINCLGWQTSFLKGSPVRWSLICARSKSVHWDLRARAHWPLCSTTCGRALWRTEHTRATCGGDMYVMYANALSVAGTSHCLSHTWAINCSVLAKAWKLWFPTGINIPATMRGHMWLNKVASVLGPLNRIASSS